jgi:dipeptidyl aminopeptidase/acylaminoacyl peptidase
MMPMRAKNANIWLVQRQSARDAPNYYATTDFKNYRRLTNLQPQASYNWLTQELVSFKHLDGKVGEGILYKPENFDPAKKYPVMIAFYGQFSNNMYQFRDPSYYDQSMASGKSPAWFLNNGYLVFTPDIQVVPLKYGLSIYNVIEGAAQYLNQLSYVDQGRIGCAAHSFSSKLGAYVFTHSTSIAASTISGCASYNPLHAALSEGDGMSKLQDFEVGENWGNLWENKDAWLDLTAVLQADKAKGALLLLENKESTPIYQEQAFQFFNALRRLDKNVWLLKYDNGEHTLHDLKELKDYTVRYTQFFDHYLKYAPAPQWMTQGVPLKLKGIESRYELDPQSKCNTPNGEQCSICEAWNKQYKKTPEMFQMEIKDWELDKDIAAELERKIAERKKVLDKEGEVRTKEVLRMLNRK